MLISTPDPRPLTVLDRVFPVHRTGKTLTVSGRRDGSPELKRRASAQERGHHAHGFKASLQRSGVRESRSPHTRCKKAPMFATGLF